MKNTFALLMVTICLLTGASSLAAKECKTGKPCGNSCIAKDAVCSK